jgi:SAM-dependent methyltransferase
MWLADRVAPDGMVVATDLDTTVLDGLSHPNLEVRVHDVLEDDLAVGEFDLVHLRLVLGWLGDRRAALRRLVGVLKPGGWLVAEDLDFASAVPDPRMGAQRCARFERIVEAHHAVIAERHGYDPGYGRSVAGDVEAAGLADSGCRGRASMWRGASRAVRSGASRSSNCATGSSIRGSWTLPTPTPPSSCVPTPASAPCPRS